jgi:very-short-patch-repair endonuclease
VDEHLSALEFRRRARPSAEAWRALVDVARSIGPGPARFRRQHVGPYVLDLFSPEHRLAVELAPSAPPGADSRFHDQVRTRYLAASGIRVLAFSEGEVLRDGPRVARDIAAAMASVDARPAPSSRRAPAR